MVLKEERLERQKIRDDGNVVKLEELVKDLDTTNNRIILRAKNIGAFTNVRSTTVTGTLLAATEFCGVNAHIMILNPPPPQLSEQIRQFSHILWCKSWT